MKRLKLIKVIASSLVVASVLVLNPIGASAEWKQDSNGWWNTEGSSWSVGWKDINGEWYYFGQDGYMVHDATIDGYKLGSDGAWIQSTQNNSLSLGADKKAATSNDNTFTTDQFVSILKTKFNNVQVEDVHKKGYFLSTTTRKKVKINDEQYYLDVYIYDSNEEMEKDALNVPSDGCGGIEYLTLDPYYYKKGSVIVMYGGENETIISNLKDIFGESFAGYRVSTSTNSTTAQGESDSEGITMKTEKSVYELGTKEIKLYIENNTNHEYDYGLLYSVEKFENNEWNTLTLDTDFDAIAIILNPKETVDAVAELSTLQDFKNLTPGKYRIVKDDLTAEFELK